MTATKEALADNAALERLVESIPHIVWIADADGKTNFFNMRASDYIGASTTERADLDWLDLLHANDAAAAQKHWEEALRTGASFGLDCRFRRLDGEYRWHEVRSEALRDHNGSTLRWIGTATDIDDHKQAAVVLERSRQESAELATLLDTLQSCAPIGFGFADRDCRMVRLNEVLAAINGATVDEHLGKKISDVIPELWPTVEPRYRQVLDTGAPVLNCRISGPSAVQPGRVHHWLASYYPVWLHEEVIGVGIVVIDVTDQEDADRALRESEARYRAIANTAREGIWTVDLAGRTQYANHRVPDVLGISLDTVYEKTAIAILDPHSNFLADRILHRHARGPEEYDLSYEHPDGVERVLHLSVSPLSDDTGARGCLAMITDVTAATRAAEQLRRQALHDPLTGLANRALLRDRLDHAFARQRRLGGAVSVTFLDLDQFKVINDAHGHAIGDEVVVQVADRLGQVMRDGDTLARFGGDEFVVVAEDTNEEQARELADRQLSVFKEPFEVSGRRMYLSASIGVATSPPVDSDRLLRSADTAMYNAKARGRGRVRTFDVAETAHAGERLALSTDLREALANNQLELHYQPVVQLDTGAVTGVEALLRWTHPTRGAVPPAQFVAVAEDTGQARALDQWVLETACDDMRRIRAMLGRAARISINISASHLSDTDLEQDVVSALRTVGAPGNALTLELTETALMDDPAGASDVLVALRSRGIHIAIDDFGTGYSCLGYLTKLPVDILKIDRCFVERITEDADAFAVTAAVIDLARRLRLSTVAEGVETPWQSALLRRLQCVAAQGFLWSPARSLAQLEADGTLGQSPRYVVAGAPLIRPRTSPWTSPVTTEHGLTHMIGMHRDGASLLTIAASLNADGYRTPEGQRWHRATVARTISAVAYPDL